MLFRSQVSLTFARAQGHGSRDNNLFYIGPYNNLRSKESFDYERNQTFSIRLKVTDEHNASLEQIFEIQVLDVDDTAPVITLNGDANITHEAGSEYIDAGAVWTDAVDGTGQAQVSGEVNASKPGTYFLTYTHSDVAGNSAIPATRKVVVVNIAPQNLETTSELNIAENLPVGELVGVFRATDRNGDVLQYGFTQGVGDGGNDYFTMDPNGTLRTAVRFDYEQSDPALSVRIFARDPYDEKVEGNFTISVEIGRAHV